MYNVGAKPTLLELKTMKGADGKPLRIVQTIAAGDYMTFGMCLLQDENGDEVELIEKDYIGKGAAGITQAILKKWLKIDAPTRTYQHLIECLKQSELGALAELIPVGEGTCMHVHTLHGEMLLTFALNIMCCCPVISVLCYYTGLGSSSSSSGSVPHMQPLTKTVTGKYCNKTVLYQA